MRRRTIVLSYLGDVDFKTSTLALDTTQEECSKMVTTGMCNDASYMQRVGKYKHAFTGDP
jgi:hypothetical protein